MKVIGLTKDQKYLLAVSGGVDSVVLLDILANDTSYDLAVAHFDHGIRPDSADDARFVRALVEEKYHLPFFLRREELGRDASEELARSHRYSFLRDVARKTNTRLVTAHHRDDLVETVAINILRGTGWRGLAALSADDIVRPLLDTSKSELLAYALAHRLEWAEDSTNASAKYLRNRLRRSLRSLDPAARQKVAELRGEQVSLRDQIDSETDRLLVLFKGRERYLISNIDPLSAMELLKRLVEACNCPSPTRPQLRRLLLAVKTARVGTVMDIGNFTRARFPRGGSVVIERARVLE